MLDCRDYAVEDLLPHSQPMVLLDRIVEYDSKNLMAEVSISVNSMFYDEMVEGVPAWVGIEYMAQSISALAGLRAKAMNQPIKLGFLLGTRKLQLMKQVLNAGQIYRIKVQQIFWDESGLANFECQILHNDELCVQASVNVFETDDVEKMMERDSD